LGSEPVLGFSVIVGRPDNDTISQHVYAAPISWAPGQPHKSLASLSVDTRVKRDESGFALTSAAFVDDRLNLCLRKRAIVNVGFVNQAIEVSDVETDLSIASLFVMQARTFLPQQIEVQSSNCRTGAPPVQGCSVAIRVVR